MGSPRSRGNPFAQTSEEESVQPVNLTAIDLNDDDPAPNRLLPQSQPRSSDYDGSAPGGRGLPPTKPPAFTSPPTAPVQGVPAPVYGSPYYGGAGGQTYPAQAPNPYAPQAPPAAVPWTSSYAPADTPLAYSTFEQTASYSYAPQGRLPCGGLGQQWTLFIIGWLIWPLWYVALCVRCYGRQFDVRERSGFLANCVMSFIFTIVWMALLAHYEWPKGQGLDGCTDSLGTPITCP